MRFVRAGVTHYSKSAGQLATMTETGKALSKARTDTLARTCPSQILWQRERQLNK